MEVSSVDAGGVLLAGDGRSVAPLGAVVKDYAWGSRTTLARLRGLPVPSAAVEAELWFGGHPSSPSALVRADGEHDLARAIAADPVGELGADVAGQYGARLPFMVKLLAIERPLSIQVHPEGPDAEAGFRDEELRGVPMGSPERSFPDPWAKSEILIALERTEARIGLREYDVVLQSLGELGVETDAILRAEPAGTSEAGWAAGLVALSAAVGLDAEERNQVIDRLIVGARAVAARPEAHGPTVLEDARTVLRSSEDHPGDLGILLSMLLEPMVLDPGDAVEVPAGVIHSYQHGTAAEVMVASDCVARFGLSRKWTDAAAALRYVRSGPGPRRLASVRSGVWTLLPTRVDGLRVAMAELTTSTIGPPEGAARFGPSIAVCLEGPVDVMAGADRVRLGSGRAAFVSARAVDVGLHGPGRVLLVGAGALGEGTP